MSEKLKVKMYSTGGHVGLQRFGRSCIIKRDRVTLGSQVLGLTCVPVPDAAKTR